MLKRFYARSLRDIITAETQRTVAVNALNVGTKIAIGVVALGTLGVDTTPVVAAAGMVGAAAGFSLKDVGSNIISGLIIASSGTFHTGDELSIGTCKGKVIAMDLKYLYLETAEGDLVLVPNSSAVSSTVLMKAGAERKKKEELLIDDHDDDSDAHGVFHAFRQIVFVIVSTATVVVIAVVFGGLKLIAAVEDEKPLEVSQEQPGEVTPKNQYLRATEKVLHWCGLPIELSIAKAKS